MTRSPNDPYTESPPGGAWWVWFQLSRTPAGSAPVASATLERSSSASGALDRQRVDAAQNDASGPALEGGSGHLERAEARVRGPVAPDDSDHREAERRIDDRARRAGSELAVAGGCVRAHEASLSKPTMRAISRS